MPIAATPGCPWGGAAVSQAATNSGDQMCTESLWSPGLLWPQGPAGMEQERRNHAGMAGELTSARVASTAHSEGSRDPGQPRW